MTRTIAELAEIGNPFEGLDPAAKLLLGRRAAHYMLRFSLGELPEFGMFHDGVLEKYGLVNSLGYPKKYSAIARPINAWTDPGGEAPAGRVACVDVMRTPFHGQRGTEGRVSETAVTLHSPSRAPANSAALRVGVIRHETDGLVAGRVDLLEVTGRNSPDVLLCRNSYGPDDLRSFTEGLRSLRYGSAAAAVLPLVADCNRILAEVAASTETRGVRLPLPPEPQPI